MSEHLLIAAGFGGQGVMLIGQILATAGMFDNKHTTWLPSYGPEMRGGTANCTVVVSDEPIASPITNTPNELIIMNIPSLIKFEKEIQSDGLMVINTSVVDRDTIRDDISIIKVDANAIAEKLGNLKVANMVVLGAYLQKTGAVTLEGVKKALEEKLTGSKAALVNLNIKAIEEGMKSVS
ncbi:2-oxoacid:ferredoxin oxidoreductase subunit gamma [Mesotoga sp. HF07.pep.5.2.highcov]|jgi:2-oxoglutarate ferredoxin oxidoreductase subunit gamma|uniref:2-oxoacid:acceptor oxidoreductase, gamma subunit, pyruvate/2-ketoisovalerate family n=1 Tax=Mesotoga prima MesG1.Ag.4.2 TaxID=660470 RepID=I2F566_9BACT|nr:MULTISPECIES: 2-oxoacid:acceptor oxidoreductase family protein [Mesotoga]AFK07069.1 2-oxoacid:acceptor oxidoreductase, gamma subunit, pyruvate/2-ketoisovalerate family [Mesotoga prima MesG1.Ag.4.2]MDK2943915.1 2-oxoglutarate ferredoxin oxidoreductase subunit gamma [Mesotoga sp.]RLL85729.1 2-oxoacid:ferredoxin oxidoreductase subunit gamma [Mesotoga sp. H07pep.5.4]RLL92361.1 2-oxoacid:ferredoxin oxidoreductase subunit gamma [Mesotoga sp. HF07.pep.5.2.highcov]